MANRIKKTLGKAGLTLATATLMIICLTSTIEAAVGRGHEFLSAPGDPVGKSCNVCHLPDEVPGSTNTNLRQTAAGTRASTMYTTYTTMAGNKGDMSGNSKLCLSCHDGATAMDSMPNSTVPTMSIGTDLTDDHPVGVAYPPRGRNGQRLPNYRSTPSSDIKLFGNHNNRVECATCHDPHGTNHPKRLRVTNREGSLCLSCHSL